MVSNEELFKKLMGFSRQMRMRGVQAPVARGGEREGFEERPMHHGHGGRGMEEGACEGMPSMPPRGEMPPYGEMPPMPPHDGMPPMPPHGRGPHEGGPHGPGGRPGRGMSREHLLVLIGDHPEGVWQRDIAGEAGINPSSASELISRLEEDGYLTREADENDRRAVLLKLTEAGSARAEEIRAERESRLDALFSRLTDEEKQTLADLLDKLKG